MFKKEDLVCRYLFLKRRSKNQRKKQTRIAAIWPVSHLHKEGGLSVVLLINLWKRRNNEMGSKRVKQLESNNKMGLGYEFFR